MGSSASSEQPPVNQNRQSNGNQFRNIDQSTGAAWLQFNWASFGGGTFQQSSSFFVSSSLPSGWPSGITGRPTKKLVEPSSTSSYSYHRGTTATMTTTKNIPRPSIPLPGIRACPPSFPRQCMSESVDMRVTRGSSPGSSSSTRHSTSSLSNHTKYSQSSIRYQ